MCARVYILLDILEGKSAGAIQNLQTMTGVIAADTLEGHPNTLVIMEASERQRLVELLMPVLGLIDHITRDLHLLVNRENKLARDYSLVTESYAKQALN